uniref:ATP synthase subunit a n=1 Tax=Falconius longicornis TaxID=2793211 RepID=A0A7T0II06_9ORTH|nr:ATP synthase F0 subunit 6 [Falconius longicornis]
MMTNLFSSFDPSTNTTLALNWLSTLIMVTMAPTCYWLTMNRPNMIASKIMYMLNQEINNIINKQNKGAHLMFISLFTFIMLNNTMGMFPYIFTSTSHMVMTLSMALPLWLALNLYGWINKSNKMFTHLVPMGTPGILMPFMVCIETISNLIRPGTLAIRLAANMIAGHLLLTLMGNTGNKINELMLTMMLITQTLLIILESAVSIIQAYVFTILTTLYSNEIN